MFPITVLPTLSRLALAIYGQSDRTPPQNNQLILIPEGLLSGEITDKSGKRAMPGLLAG